MTRSREDERKRAARARPPAHITPTLLSTLCLVRGCLNPRTGANLCDDCDQTTTERTK
jgi:hypothetical protein